MTSFFRQSHSEERWFSLSYLVFLSHLPELIALKIDKKVKQVIKQENIIKIYRDGFNIVDNNLF